MAQNVNSEFIKTAKSAQKTTEFRVMISWSKELRRDAGFFRLNSSRLDSGDILKGSSEVVALFDKYNYVEPSTALSSAPAAHKHKQPIHTRFRKTLRKPFRQTPPLYQAASPVCSFWQ